MGSTHLSTRTITCEAAYHREVVPDGYDVNHKNGKNLDFPDGSHNVEILPSPVNRSSVLMGEF